MDEQAIFSNLQIVCRRVQRFKDLGGFDRTFRVPNKVDSAARQFLHQLGAKEMSEDLDQKFSLFRQLFGFKRKQLKLATPQEGQGSLSTPLFDYCVELDFLRDDPAQVQWRRSFARLKDLRTFAKPENQSLFQDDRIELDIHVDQSLDLEAIIDAIEESDASDLVVDYDNQVTWCRVGILGRSERLHFSTDQIVMAFDHRYSKLPHLIEGWLLIYQQLERIVTVSKLIQPRIV